MIEREGRGAIVYQQQEGRGIGILNKIRAYALQDEGADTVEANERLGLAVDLRNYKQCAEVLFDLGLCQVKVISNNPLKLRALEEAGLRIVERVSIQVEPTENAAHYLRTKKQKLGHLLEFEN
jgi:3,4-dihydroxy 2-butanone 4-phosphate synthase/GTP cyclohydrolase II